MTDPAEALRRVREPPPGPEALEPGPEAAVALRRIKAAIRARQGAHRRRAEQEIAELAELAEVEPWANSPSKIVRRVGAPGRGRSPERAVKALTRLIAAEQQDDSTTADQG